MLPVLVVAGKSIRNAVGNKRRDWSLFVFSRFREELRKSENKYQAMEEAVKEVAEPIFFSGGTVFAAMLVVLLAGEI